MVQYQAQFTTNHWPWKINFLAMLRNCFCLFVLALLKKYMKRVHFRSPENSRNQRLYLFVLRKLHLTITKPVFFLASVKVEKLEKQNACSVYVSWVWSLLLPCPLVPGLLSSSFNTIYHCLPFLIESCRSCPFLMRQQTGDDFVGLALYQITLSFTFLVLLWHE